MVRKIVTAGLIMVMSAGFPVSACTGISLAAKDGAVVAGRTVEWSLGDASHYRIAIFPRGKHFTALTPEGQNGKRWVSRFGFVGLTAYGQDYGPDGLNEKGFYVGMYYLPGFADYSKFEPAQRDVSVSVGDLMQWMLSSFDSVEQALKHLNDVRVVHVDDARFGGAALPFHWKIADPTGRSAVIEIVEGGKVKIYEAASGVITNSPTYDWHLINLRNYLGLSPTAPQPITSGGYGFSPLGAGAGMIGLPGDFSPPSRFVRAAAFVATARPLQDAEDAVFESFRILDSFNIPLGSVLPVDKIPGDITGATQITSVSDLRNRVYYYHTMFNRRIRKIDLRQIDFGRVKQQIVVDDADKKQDLKTLTVIY